MKTLKNMALSTGFEITKAASWRFGNQPDRQGFELVPESEAEQLPVTHRRASGVERGRRASS